MSRILYLTDRYKVAQGYESAFTKLVGKAGINRSQIICTDIYSLVESPLKKKGNETVWRFDPAKLPEITKAFAQRVNSIRPTVIVVSCPAVLGVLAEGDTRLATLEKMRGGVYYYGPDRIPTIVTYPITAIHQRIDSRILENDDGEEDKQAPYRVPQGATILKWDWEKVGRFFAGKQRILPPFRYSICRTLEDCYAAREYLRQCVLIGTDIETGNFPPGITCVGYTGLRPDGSVHSFVFPFFDAFREGGCFWDSVDDHATAWSVCRDINDSPVPKTMQGGSYDCSYFIRDRIPARAYWYDLMVMWWSINMELPKRLDFISSILLDNFQYWKDDIKGDKIDEGVSVREQSTERYWRYNALDCYNTLFGTLYMMKILEKNQAMQRNYNDAMRRVYSALGMSMRGVKADFRRRDEHRTQLESDRDKNLATLRYMICDDEFNINSAPQKASLLYDFFGLRERTARGRYVDPNKPKSGNNAISAGKIPLKMAKTEHPFFKRIIDQMESAMEPDHQISQICDMKLYTDRFRTSYGAVATETTRLNSKKSAFWDGTNAQNIRDKYRDWLVADPAHVLLDVDFSQSDDVFVAYESEDPDKIAVIESGLDAHAVNGELFFGRTYDWIVKGKELKLPEVVHPIYGVRQLAKKTVHGTNFQMAAMTLYITMGREAVVAAAELLGHKDAGVWDQERLVQLCGHLMAKYRKRYKRLTAKEWYADILKELRTGQITNAFGITRRFLGNPDDNATQREATAFMGQSGTGGNMNRVMAEVDLGYIPPRFRDGPNPDAHDTPRQMNWESHGFALHLQTHDSFTAQLNLNHPQWKLAAHNLLYVMARPIIIKGRTFRVKTDASLGFRWGKNMLDWDGDMTTLDGIIHQLRERGPSK